MQKVEGWLLQPLSSYVQYGTVSDHIWPWPEAYMGLVIRAFSAKETQEHMSLGYGATFDTRSPLANEHGENWEITIPVN